ncbi:MAG: superoxide dismutase [Candidatus Babeliaceae bacterium]
MYKLPALPYAYDALEPYIDARTMEIHYTKHHQGYVDNLNKALEKHPTLFEIPLSALLHDLSRVPEDIRTAVRNNGGGDANHTFFWPLMKPHGGGKPIGKVELEITRTFGSFETFKDQFSQAAKSVFGSGWAWLCINKQAKFVIHTTPNQDSPLSADLIPLLGLDVWEHAYYLHYQNRRPDYINAWWHVVNWEQVEENFKTL